MKRFFAICFFLCLLAPKGFGQTINYRLEYLMSFPYLVDTSGIDTFTIGQTYYMNIYIVNLDSTPVSGFSENFDMAAVYPRNQELVKPQYVNTITTKPVNIPAMPGYGHAEIQVPIIFTNYYKLDSENIVIVWPVGGYSGSNSVVDQLKDTFGYQPVYLKDSTKTTAIAPVQGTGVRFSVFPNPASDYIYITTNNLQNAIIKIAGLEGRVLAQYPIPASAGNQDLTIPVQSTGLNLKNGMYFIILQSNEYSEVKKLLIVR